MGLKLAGLHALVLVSLAADPGLPCSVTMAVMGAAEGADQRSRCSRTALLQRGRRTALNVPFSCLSGGPGQQPAAETGVESG